MSPLTSRPTNQRHAPARNTPWAVLIAPPVAFVVANLCCLVLLRFIHADAVVRITYNTNTIVIPVLFVLAALIRFMDPAPGRRLALTWLGIALLLAGLRVYATHIEPNALQLRELTITSEKISRPFTLLHITDIQSAGIGAYEEGVFERIRALNPDLIVHTGDLLQPQHGRTHATELPKLARLFSTLAPPFGMFTVQGESDFPIIHMPPESMGGLRFLHSEPTEIKVDGLHIRLLGLSLAHTRLRRDTPMDLIENWLAESPPEALNIVLGHRPEYVLRASALPIDLCLAGHTHGGQIRIPFYGAITTSSVTPREWARGYRAVGKTHLNVSAGIGAGHNKGLPSIRFNCPPEMTLIRFEPAAAPN